MELKERIIEGTSKLFFHKGIRSVTMTDIANHLGISKRTLYEVFSDKEQLLGECLDRSIEKADREMYDLVNQSGNAIDTLMRIYAVHLNEMHNVNKATIHDIRKYHPTIYRKIESKQKKGMETFFPIMENGIREGLIRKDVNFEVLAWLLKAQFKMVMDGDFIPTDKYSVGEFMRAIILNFMRAIATQEGLKIMDELILKLDYDNNKQNN